MSDDLQDRLRQLPQLDVLLRRDDLLAAAGRHGRLVVASALRSHLDAVRQAARGGAAVPDADTIAAATLAALAARDAHRLTRVVNATGVILHTNLGRAPLSRAARDAVTRAAGYTSLEYDLATGRRGSRTAAVGMLAAEVCGTPAATVVNNGAAALVLVLAALGAGRETVVSRGELVEIGGSYRLPDIMTVAGTRLVEVGTTNRTRLDDYATAVGEDTGLLLKVHRSNFAMIGFTEEVSVDALAGLAGEHAIPLVHDLGSGLLHDDEGPLRGEPSVHASVRAGADLVVFSGDKLLGGPQAGIIAGDPALVRTCTRHPLARAMRIDKLQRAALEATLEAHLRAEVPVEIPTVAMLHTDLDHLRRRAERLATILGEAAAPHQVSSVIGGGALPGRRLPSWGVTLATDDPDGLAARLRNGACPVVGRIDGAAVVLDLRTVPPAQDEELASLVQRALDGMRDTGNGASG